MSVRRPRSGYPGAMRDASLTFVVAVAALVLAIILAIKVF
jgi:hypothetical protein